MKDVLGKLFDSIPLTLIVIGFILIVLGALGGIPLNTPVQPIDFSAKIIFYIFGGICFFASPGWL